MFPDVTEQTLLQEVSMPILKSFVFSGAPQGEITSAELEKRVNLERTKIYFSNTFGSATALMLGIFLAVALLSAFNVSWTKIILWALLSVIIGMLIFGYERSIHRQGFDSNALEKQVAIRLFLSLVLTFVWGYLTQLMPSHDRLGYTLSYIAMTTFVNIGMLSFSVIPMQFLLYFIGALAPLEMLLWHDYNEAHDLFYLLLMAIIVVCEGMLLIKALINSRTAIRSIILNEKLKDQITQTQKAQNHIEYLAYHDSLTGVWNRRYIEHYVKKLIRKNHTFALLLLDINYFKAINDTYGHRIGDGLLMQFSQTLQRHLPNKALLGRLGGDEFMVIVEDATYAHLSELALLLKNAVHATYTIHDIDVSSSASIGWAMFPIEAPDLETLTQLADERMYEDKRNDHLKD